MGSKTVKQHVVKVKSTQMYSPIRDVRDGIIITKDGRFIKLMEFSPINFSLRSAKERNGIIDVFSAAVRLMPTNTQWKIISKAADVSHFVDGIRAEMETEKNEDCIYLQQEQIDLISRLGAKGGVSRRFLVAFEYEQPPGMVKTPSFEEIKAELESTALRIAGVMEPNGNELLSPAGDDIYTLETLWSIMCRSESAKTTFDERIKDVVFRYMEDPSVDFDDENTYIPVNEFICPQEVDTALSPRFIKVDGLYYSFAYIPSHAYPSTAVGGWMTSLINFGIDVDIDLFLKKVNTETVQRNLTYNMRLNKIRVKDTEDSSTGYDELVESLQSGYYLRKGVSSGDDFIYMSAMVTICAESEKQLQAKTAAMKAYLTAQGLDMKQCLFLHSECFQASLPLCSFPVSLYKKSRRNVLASDLGSAYPFVSFEVADPGGIMWGVNESNNSLVFVDSYDTHQYKNANMVILGTSGAGKTFTLGCIALRLRAQKTQVIIIAPEKGFEFKRACKAIGGQYIKLAPGSPQTINIMEIRKSDDSSANIIDGETGSKDSILAKKIQSLHTFMALILPDITNEEKQLVDEALVKTYQKFTITHRNRSLIDPKTGKYKKMPVLGDLRETFLGMGDEAKRLANALKRYVSGSVKSFNSQTNVNLDNMFVVIDVSELTDELLPVGMYTALEFSNDKAKEDRTQKKAIIVDEAWKLQQAENYIVKIFKTIRGYGGAAIAATQDIHDFFANGSFGKSVLTNSKTKILMGMEADEVAEVAQILDLTEQEEYKLTRFKTGQALIAANSNHIIVNIKASQYEHDLLTTSRVELQRIKAEKSKAAKYVDDSEDNE